MYANFLKSEIKKWSRDSMMGFMAIYPVVFGFLGRYFLPWLSKRNGFDFTPFNDLILVVLVLIVPISYGAVIGFSILEDRDDNVLTNIKVTPLSIHQFLGFRLVMVYLFCFIATVFVIWFSRIGDIPLGNIISISLLASLEAPISGLLINCFAKNKIEGFAVMKAGGSIIIFPIIGLFFRNIKELYFSFAPGFWPAKAISIMIKGDINYLSYNQYYFIGLLYMVILNILSYRLFINRTRLG